VGEDGRLAELAANLAEVRERIAGACAHAGRTPDAVTLIVVTKTWPAADVIRLGRLGVLDVGENRDQEAAPKAEEVDREIELRWHFVGQLQRNKARSVVRYADMVHSVDGVRLARSLDEAARRHRQLPLDVLVQVSVDGDPARGGAVDGSGGPDDDHRLPAVLAAVAEADGLALRGLMAVAPMEWEPARAFARLAEIAAAVRASYPDAVLLSAGMSGDFEQAIDYGATHVRMGQAVLGSRSALM
jgi:pyridoxal phosphate enzyme (YggS family)